MYGSAWREPNQNTLKRLFYYAYAFFVWYQAAATTIRVTKIKDRYATLLIQKYLQGQMIFLYGNSLYYR